MLMFRPAARKVWPFCAIACLENITLRRRTDLRRSGRVRSVARNRRARRPSKAFDKREHRGTSLRPIVDQPEHPYWCLLSIGPKCPRVTSKLGPRDALPTSRFSRPLKTLFCLLTGAKAVSTAGQ